MELAELYKALSDCDAVVCKAAKVREVARIARIETMLRKYLLAEWTRIARTAAEEAERIVRSGSGEITAKDHARVMSMINAKFRKFPSRVRNRVHDDLEDVYRLARIAGHRKATGRTRQSLQYDTRPFRAKKEDQKLEPINKADEQGLFPSFDLQDKEAIKRLQKDQMFWIGQHYDQNVRDSISEVTRREMLEKGLTRSQVGRIMEGLTKAGLAYTQVPDGWTGTAAQYFESLVANAATTARVQGQVRSFVSTGVTTYEIVNPFDERTCPVCSHMDGKVFSVEHGREQIERELEAGSPEEVKRVHPWIRASQLREISPKAGSQGDGDAAALAKAGFALPPFHFRCRCTVDVRDFE